MGTAIQLFLHLPSIYLPGLRSSEGNTRNPARPRRLHRNFICKFIAVICGVSIDPNLNSIHASIFQYFEKNTFTNLSTQSIRIHFQNTIIPSYAFATLIQIFGRYFTKLVYTKTVHTRKICGARVDTFLFLAITLRPPFVSSDVETFTRGGTTKLLYRPLARSLIWFTIGLPPSPPGRKLCPRFSARENCSTNLYLPARGGEGWRNLPSPVRKKIYRSYAVSKAVGGTAVKSWRFYAFSRSLERRRRVKYQFGLLQSDGLDRRYFVLLKEYFYVIAVIII